MYKSRFHHHCSVVCQGLLLATLLGACVETPTLPEPEVAVPERWQGEVTTSVPRESSESWWRDLGSEELDALIEQALRANRDLRIAAARLAQARALAGEVDGERLPQLSATASASRGREVTLDPKSDIRRAGFVASWEADVFGQKGLASHAARLDADGAELARQAVQTVVAAETAGAYIDAASLERRIALGRQRLGVLLLAVDVAQKQYVAGHASRVDIDRRRAAELAYRAEYQQLQSALRQRLLQLSVLLGATPGSVQPTYAGFETLRFDAPATSLPGELLERRPDVQRQARAVSAAAARVGVARLELYPRFVFSWANSRESAQIDEQDAATDIALGYGVSLSLPIFDGGRIRSRIVLSEARLDEAMAAYEKAMIEALADAQTVLVRQDAWRRSLRDGASAVASGETLVADTRKLFAAGLADRGALIDGELALLQARDTLLQAQDACWLASVDVYRAFSGRIARR